MSDQSSSQAASSKPQLANSTLWLMAMICGLCAGGNYFNQPLLHSIQTYFQVDAAMAQLTVTCAQVSYAVGLLFLVPLGDLLKRQYLIPVLMILTAIGLMISAFAQNIYVCDDIVQTVKANHTNASAYERIVRQPMFDGYVEQGRNYVILDDTVAMGGTLAALRGYIESQGGRVILAMTITGFSVPELDIVPNQKTLNYVLTKHPKLSQWWQHEFGFPVEYLTQGELGHFKKPNSLDEIRSRLIEAGLQSSDETS